MHQRVVVLDPAFEEDFVGNLRKFPTHQDDVPRGAAAETFSMSSIDRSRMAVSCSRVIAMGFSCEYPWTPISCPASTIIRVRSGTSRSSGPDEPGGRQPVFLEEADEAGAADFTAEQTAGDVTRRVFASVGAEHSGNGVHVDAERDLDVLSHEINLSLGFLLELCGEVLASGCRGPATCHAGRSCRDAVRWCAEAEQQAQENQRLGGPEQPRGYGARRAQIVAAAVAIDRHDGAGLHAGACHYHDAGRGGRGDLPADLAVGVARSRSLEDIPSHRPGGNFAAGRRPRRGRRL